MQVALLVPEQEWQQLLADVQRLKEFEAAIPKTPPPPPDRLLNVRQAADFLNITPAGLRRARRAGRRCWRGDNDCRLGRAAAAQRSSAVSR